MVLRLFWYEGLSFCVVLYVTVLLHENKKFTIIMVKRESITVTHYSLVIVTENCQIEGNLGYS